MQVKSWMNWLPGVVLCVPLVLVGALCTQLAAPRKSEVELAGYATSLKGRTASQRFNARKAAEALNGKWKFPEATASK